MSEQTRKLIDTIRARLEKTRRNMTRSAVLAGLAIATGVAASLWFMAVALEAGLWMTPFFRSSVLLVVMLGTGIVLFREIAIPIAQFTRLLDGHSEENVARRIGHEFPEIQDRLINLIQLTEGAHSPAPEPLIDGAIRTLGERIQGIPFERIATLDRAHRFSRWSLFPILAVVFFAGFAPDAFSGASARLLSPLSDFQPPVPFVIHVTPGDVEIIKGDSIRISVRISGESGPGELSLEMRNEGEVRSQTIDIGTNDSGNHSYDVLGIRQSLLYRVSGPPILTRWFRVSVVERPLVQSIHVSLTFPAYSRLPDRSLETNVGDISALHGTRVSIRMTLGGSVTSAGNIIFSDGTRFPLDLRGNQAVVSFQIQSDIHYWIELQSIDAVSNSAPIRYIVHSIEDANPSIVFLAPEPESMLTDAVRTDLRVHLSDDYGFSSLRLFYRLAGSRFGTPEETFSSMPLPLSHSYTLDQEIDFGWDLRSTTSLDPVPGDVIEFYVRVWDNDTIRGHKSAVTDTYSLHFPSLADQYEALDSAEEDAESTLEDLIDEARDIREQFERLKDDLLKKPDSDWQDERRLEQLQQSQENLESKVEDLSMQIEEITNQMNQNDLVSEQTLQLFEELRQVVEEISTPELMDALRDLQESLNNMDLNQMQQSLENFEFNERMYQQRLERTLELFKQLRVQKDLEEAARRADDLAKLEDRLAEETARLQNEQSSEQLSVQKENPDAERLAREQEQASRDMTDLEQKLQETRERMEDLRNAPVERMRNLEEDTQDLRIPDRMKENADQLRQNEFDHARSDQQKMQDQLKSINDQLTRMQQNMQGQQMEMNLAGVRSTLQNVLMLSERQESLRSAVNSMTPDSPRLRESAQKQADLSEGLSVVADSLQSLARELPQMTRSVQKHTGDALREMERSTGTLAERLIPQASGHQKGAMMHLNELALILSDLLNQMMNSGTSAGGMSMQQFMEQMQQLGEQQEQLNKQIQQLLNDAQGNRLTSNMLERLRQLGGQQDQIRGDLKQLSRSRHAQDKSLGNLSRIAEQMLESIEELTRSQITQRTIQRQREILTRLLDASRSLQERGKEKERRSKTGEDIRRSSPDSLSPSEQLEKLRRDLFKALDSGYAPDFERLIRKYFDLLQQHTENAEYF